MSNSLTGSTGFHDSRLHVSSSSSHCICDRTSVQELPALTSSSLAYPASTWSQSNLSNVSRTSTQSSFFCQIQQNQSGGGGGAGLIRLRLLPLVARQTGRVHAETRSHNTPGSRLPEGQMAAGAHRDWNIVAWAICSVPPTTLRSPFGHL